MWVRLFLFQSGNRKFHVKMHKKTKKNRAYLTKIIIEIDNCTSKMYYPRYIDKSHTTYTIKKNNCIKEKCQDNGEGGN